MCYWWASAPSRNISASPSNEHSCPRTFSSWLRTVDLHALRHTFGTHLSKNGVAPRTTQAAMRHSSLGLTMNVYTNPELLAVAGAVEALPRLNVDDAKSWEPEQMCK